MNVTTYTEDEFVNGPITTPAAKLFRGYVANVDSAEYNKQPQDKFYSHNVKFFNCNGAVYHGYTQMTTWMRELFAPFEAMMHTYDKIREIDNADGTYSLDVWSTRNIWIKGRTHDGNKPDVGVPLMISSVIGPDETVEGDGRLRMIEVHLYWDTGVLSGLLPADSVVFRQTNPSL